MQKALFLSLINLSLVCFISSNGAAQDCSISIGTDIPYQHYVGFNIESQNFDFSVRTGILVPPYSDVILTAIESLGTDEIYTNLLDKTYDFGWMNSLGAYYKFGERKNWYVGPEFRLDYFTASETRKEIIETLLGQSISRVNSNSEIKLGVRTFALGFRIGKSISLSSNNKHYLKTELSIIKHVGSRATVTNNGNNLERVSQEVDRILWDNFFKPYGFLAGVGFAYSYRF